MRTLSSAQGSPFALTELIDHICSFIDRPKDLLSFALTSKQIYKVVVPNHIEFRHLRCDFRRVPIWHKLAALPAVASRFVSLEIIVEGGSCGSNSIIPKHSALLASCDTTTKDLLFDWNPRYFFAEDEHDYDNYELGYQLEHEGHMAALQKCMHSFVAALRCMSGLIRFHWLIEQISPSKEVSVALLNCPAIEDIDIFSSRDAGPSPAEYGVRRSIDLYFMTLLIELS